MAEEKQKGLIPIVLEKDIDENWGFAREDTGQIVDKKDIQVLTEPPINFVSGHTHKEVGGKIYLKENIKFPKEANALLFGKMDYETTKYKFGLVRPASYCVLTERPDDGTRRLLGK